MSEKDTSQPMIAKTFKHGRGAYHCFKCRCDICRKEEAQYRKEYRKRRFNSGDFTHGYLGYRYGCRCNVCRNGKMSEPIKPRKPRKHFNGDLSRVQFNHGSWGWSHYGCRCDICKKGREDDIKRLKERTTFKHGISGYTLNKCRCDVCVAAAKTYRQKFITMPFKHGLSGYKHHKCRCDVCRMSYSEHNKNYTPPNKEKYAESRRKRENIRMKTDIEFRILKNIRSRLWAELKGKDKCARTMKIVGCSTEELKKHLESKFQPGMSWDNWSLNGWHIDHIRPCSSFDLSDSQQQKDCFSWKNLQPLWAYDNLAKKDKWDMRLSNREVA